MVLKYFSKGYQSASTFIQGATKLRFFNRLTVVFGLTMQIIVTSIQSAATLSPVTWIWNIAVILMDINTQMIEIITALQAGPTKLKALQLTLALYSLVYVQYWFIKKMSNFLRWLAFSDNTAEMPLNLVVVGVVALLQIIGGFIVQKNFVIPYSGLASMMTNIDIWLQPTMELLNSINLPTEMLQNNSSKPAPNISNSSEQVFT